MSFFEEPTEGEQRLTMVIVSDVHKRLDRVRQLLDWLARDEDEGGCRVPVADVLLCAGDIAHRTVAPDSDADTAACTAAAADMSAVLMALENVCARLVYVPGNHDAPCAFAAPPPALTVHACNAHGRHVRVLPGLVVVGLGGSAPAVSAGQPVRWSAYPYADDAALEAALARALTNEQEEQEKQQEEEKGVEDKATDAGCSSSPMESRGEKEKEKEKEEEAVADINVSLGMVPHAVERPGERLDAARDFAVLLTHAGPDASPTSVDYTAAPAPVEAGSAAVARAVAAGPHVFGLAVHGHTHSGRGAATLARGTLVVNPGALADGHFAVCTLVRRAAAPRWAVETLVLHALPPLPAAAELHL